MVPTIPFRRKACGQLSRQNRAYTVGYVPQNDKEATSSAICLQSQWLKATGFDKDCTLIVKIMDDFLVLIPNSDDTLTIKQQYRRQQDQLSEIKLRMRELIGDYRL
ncbi:type I addiction module toxin, SymE family [Proteus mirabilis]|nr:type I addiction module toxin, SymE family [Proteus mirabilis]HEK0658308.1 SymE family type I addiction module toxin [Proteus mirabilis]HEK2070874.1 SymE family type I addiction module toxin [Proteus mirabilis]